MIHYLYHQSEKTDASHQELHQAVAADNLPLQSFASPQYTAATYLQADI